MREKAISHLKKHDHWTFMAGFILVLANVFVSDRRISTIAAGFFAFALGYDVYEVATGVEE